MIEKIKYTHAKQSTANFKADNNKNVASEIGLVEYMRMNEQPRSKLHS